MTRGEILLRRELKREMGSTEPLLEEEIERLRAELKLEEDNRKYLNEQIERLHSIIKEVREYIETKYDYLLGDDTFLDHDERIDRKQINHIIEILKGSDKE